MKRSHGGAPILVASIAALVAAGCGRIGYEPWSLPGDGETTEGGAGSSEAGSGSADAPLGNGDATMGEGGGGDAPGTTSPDAPSAADGTTGADGANAGDAATDADAATVADATADGAGDACVVTNGGVETCDGLDNDCNGTIDDGAVCGTACVGATYAGHAYAYCSTPTSAGDTGASCAAKSMRLARIDDAAENQFVASLAFAGYAPGDNSISIWPWIGASDIASPVEWRWPDGTVFWTGTKSGGPVGGLYSNWAAASPGDSTGTSCAAMQHTGNLYWVDRACSSHQPFVCEAY